MNNGNGDAPIRHEREQALDALGDATCRRILKETLAEPLTARELVERCDGSRSTVYRKLNTLVENGFLTPSNRIRMEAKDATQFESTIDSMHIEFTEDGEITVDGVPGDGETA